MAKASPQTYVVRTKFNAPVPFVLRWCTDYSPTDAKLERSRFRRRILKRSPGRVVFEDLDHTPEGWVWSRWTVTIHPPDRWHGEAVGNYRGWHVDYRLTSLPRDRTLLTLRGRRTPMVLGTENPSKRSLERGLAHDWENFRRALEADYARSRRPARRRSRTA